MARDIQVSIRGFLVGHIWMPATECYKDLNYDATREQARTIGKMTLRDHVLRATNDGDFQSCRIAHGCLVLKTTKQCGATRVTRSRVFPLDRFPSIYDCLNTEWDGPDCDD